jgi:hypothetical protein
VAKTLVEFAGTIFQPVRSGSRSNFAGPQRCGMLFGRYR